MVKIWSWWEREALLPIKGDLREIVIKYNVCNQFEVLVQYGSCRWPCLKKKFK